MKGHHDESKLAVQTPPQELHSQHFKSDAVLDNSAEHLDEIEARSGPSAKRRLSMHSSEGAVSEGGDPLDSLSLQDFQEGSASEEDKEEGSAAEEGEGPTIRDKMIWREMGRTLDKAFEFKKTGKWTPPPSR